MTLLPAAGPSSNRLDYTFCKDHTGHKVPRDTKPLDLELRLVPPHPKGKAFGVIPMSLYPHKANQVKQSPAGLYKDKKKKQANSQRTKIPLRKEMRKGSSIPTDPGEALTQSSGARVDQGRTEELETLA